MAIRTVTLSPSEEGERLSFAGTNADEQVILSNPDRLPFAAELNFSGGNDKLASTDPGLEWGRIRAGSGNDQLSAAAQFDLLIDGGTGNEHAQGRGRLRRQARGRHGR
jgi:hypothetical protein